VPSGKYAAFEEKKVAYDLGALTACPEFIEGAGRHL